MCHFNVQTDDKPCPSEWSYQRLQGRRIPTSSRERTLSSRILPLRRRLRRKTKRDGCFTCGSEEHWANKCPNKYKKPGQDSKSVNVTLSNNDGASGYGNLFTVLSVCQSTDWWVDTGANIHVCADVSLFSSYQVARDCSVLMGNGSHASIHGVGTVDLKFTSGKIVQLKNMQMSSPSRRISSVAPFYVKKGLS